jgi:hypothetical protein
MKNLYFVYTGASSVETEVVRELRPPRLLLSYYYFRNKALKDVCDVLGYEPEIILDSGAYSAFTKGKNIALVDYMNYIERNKEYIKYYITLDVIGDSRMSMHYFNIMTEYGFNPVPVFHYGESEEYLTHYVSSGCDYIALGGTVPIQNKQTVAYWVDEICEKYPQVKFHLLGSSSKKLLDTDVTSLDSSTWIMAAVNGMPKHIKGSDRESKKLRAIDNMKTLMNLSPLFEGGENDERDS